MHALSAVSESWSAPFFALTGLVTREVGGPWEKCQRVWCLCRNLAVKVFSSFAAAVLPLQGILENNVNKYLYHPCSAFCLTLTVSFHQVSFLWLLFNSRYSSPAGFPQLLLCVVLDRSSCSSSVLTLWPVGTQEVKLQCMKLIFSSVCSVWRGFVKSCHVFPPKIPWCKFLST